MSSSHRRPSGGSQKGKGKGRGGGGGAGRKGRKKESEVFNKTSSAIANVLDNLKNQLKALEREIRADKAGKKEFEERLALLNRQKEQVTKRLKANEEWARSFDAEIGPFEKKYQNLTGDIATLYDNAKEEHAKGIEVLIKEFDYHPLFKRKDGEFTATPFRPN